MKSLSLILHFAALTTASVCAYLVFQGPAEKQVKAVQILNIRMPDLERLTFVSPARTVEVKPRDRGGFAIAILEQVEEPVAQQTGGKAGEKDSDSETETGEPQTQEPGPARTKTASYRLSKVFEEKWAELLPLVALRDLGQITPGDLGKFGLAKGDRKLVFKTAAQEVVFEVGDQTFGSTATYLRSEPDGTVYLVPSELLSSIDFSAPRFMERRLVGFEKGDIKTILVETNSAEKELERRGAGNNAEWSVKGSPNTSGELLDNWINEVLRLSVKQYTPTQEVPQLERVAKIEFGNESGHLETMDLALSNGGNEKSLHFARTDFTGQWVEIESADAQTAISDLSAIIEQN